MMAFEDILAKDHLQVLGWSRENVPAPYQSIALIGPGPDFWQHFRASPEMQDGAAHAMDRWSVRVLDECARQSDAQALYPFGGPPYHPFIGWATGSGQAWQSPVGFLVHAKLGLFVSFRGAMAFTDPVPVSEPATQPCLDCHQPCRTACPVDALRPDSYDVEACKNYLDTPAGTDCRINGCKARRACPVGQTLRAPEQSAFHMEAFCPAKA